MSTHVFAVAIETYQNQEIKKVDFAENDAREFVEAWKMLGVDPANCTTRLSANATKTTLESSLRKFTSKITKDDTAIFFFAGHGFAQNDESYLTSHDTQPGDFQQTSIPLGWLLGQFRESNCTKIILFVDASQAGLPIASGMRSIMGKFSPDELRSFCLDAEHHMAFAACKVNEISRSSTILGHGIWSFALINALRGNAPEAFATETIITGDSLRDYLAREVPRLLIKTRMDNATQTPCCFGNVTKQFIVADLGKTLQDQERLRKEANERGALGHGRIQGKKIGYIKKLSGFKKGHRVPESHTRQTNSFVQDCGITETKDHAEAMYQHIKSGFSYKQKDMEYNSDGGFATIKTPDFDVNISIEQDASNADQYVIITEVDIIRNNAMINDDRFNDIFSPYCNALIMPAPEDFDIKSAIDRIESHDSPENCFKCAADSSSFTWKIVNLDIEIKASQGTIEITNTRSGNIKNLLDGIRFLRNENMMPLTETRKATSPRNPQPAERVASQFFLG